MDTTTLLTVAGAVITTIIGVLGTVWAARARARVDVGAAITSGFNELTNPLQEEREALMATIKRQREEIVGLEAELRAEETLGRKMRRHVERLEARLETLGETPPPRAGWE